MAKMQFKVRFEESLAMSGVWDLGQIIVGQREASSLLLYGRLSYIRGWLGFEPDLKKGKRRITVFSIRSYSKPSTYFYALIPRY